MGSTQNVYSLETLPRPLAFVFSGGVSLGAMQVGMLRAVCQSGITPDLVIGSSAGAINAAFIGQGFGEERIEALAEIWLGLTLTDVFGSIGVREIINLLSGRKALASPDALRGLIAGYIPDAFEDQLIPTFVTATDYLSGDTFILRTGSLHESLLASSAIPFVFPPVIMQGRTLIDGSVTSRVPLLSAQKLGARTLVVFDVGYPCMLEEPPETTLEKALHFFSIMLNRQPLGELSSLKKDRIVLYLPSPCPLSVANYDFSESDSLIKTGYVLTRDFLEGLFLFGPGIYGHPHYHEDL